MRVAIAGISHEALNFSPLPTTLADFRTYRGEEILAYDAIGDLFRELELEPVPILLALSNAPSGAVREADYLQLRDEIVAELQAAGPVDGVCLILHGALLVENVWSGETDLVREIRAALGYDVPLVARLDMHANLTEEFACKVNTWCSFRTAPHRDMRETLARTLRHLKRIIVEDLRPVPQFVRIPLLLQGEKATTEAEPMRSLLAQVAALESQRGILNAELFVGFGWADAPHAGSNIVVVAESPEHVPAARTSALALAQEVWQQRDLFSFDREVVDSIDEAIERALAAPEASVFLTDSGDNVTAGAPGDLPLFLSRLIAKQVPDAVVAGIADAEAFASCLQAGVGQRVQLRVGGKLDSRHAQPFALTGTVEHLYTPSPGEPGVRMATVQVDGVRVIITEGRKYFKSPDDFRNANVEPLAHKIVVVKLGYLLPQLRDLAPREIIVATVGHADLNLKRLPYRYVCRPIFPLDPPFTWQPAVVSPGSYESSQ